jgi:hypothetical protein
LHGFGKRSDENWVMSTMARHLIRDHLIGNGEQLIRHSEAERLGGFDVYEKLLLFIRFAHDRRLVFLLLLLVLVFILVVIIVVGIPRRHDAVIGDERSKVLRDARGHIIAPRMGFPQAFSHEKRGRRSAVAATPSLHHRAA